MAHGEGDDIVNKVRNRVQKGMGLIVLHPATLPRFSRSSGTRSYDLKWREDGDIERLWSSTTITRYPGHRRLYRLPSEEATARHLRSRLPMNFFISWFEGGEAFRLALHIAAATARFLFPSGTRVCSDLSRPEYARVIENAVKWQLLSAIPTIPPVMSARSARSAERL